MCPQGGKCSFCGMPRQGDCTCPPCWACGQQRNWAAACPLACQVDRPTETPCRTCRKHGHAGLPGAAAVISAASTTGPPTCAVPRGTVGAPVWPIGGKQAGLGASIARNSMSLPICPGTAPGVRLTCFGAPGPAMGAASPSKVRVSVRRAHALCVAGCWLFFLVVIPIHAHTRPLSRPDRGPAAAHAGTIAVPMIRRCMAAGTCI